MTEIKHPGGPVVAAIEVRRQPGTDVYSVGVRADADGDVKKAMLALENAIGSEGLRRLRSPGDDLTPFE